LLSVELNFQLISVKKRTSDSNDLEIIELITAQDISLLKESAAFSSVLFTDYLTFTVPSGEPYTDLERMFLMFDKSTWICIGVTFTAALLLIQLLNFMSIWVQKFVFGRDIRTPTLNVAAIFLTGSQHRVPGRNFARFMLMMFAIWALIIRTCYQSELYKNLQGDLRKPRIQTVDELNKQNFTLIYENFQKSFSGEPVKL
jgi:hypothetical protein